MNGDGPDKQMIDTAGAVADFAYKQGVSDAVAVDNLIQKYRALRAEVERLRAENRQLSDAVRERPIRHLPVNGPDDRQPNAPSTEAGRRAAAAGGHSSEQSSEKG